MNDTHRLPRSTQCLVETLEGRKLLSGSWTTVDTLPTGSASWVNAMTADSDGNVYAAGGYNGVATIRVKAVGSNSFVTIPSPATSDVYSIASDAQGNLFATGVGPGYQIFERLRGKAAFRP